MTDLDRLGVALSDRYRLERELGQGGMATVYLAAPSTSHPTGSCFSRVSRARSVSPST